jgi:NADH:ubiquinone oxidoreductase subunit 2 (subunit N)
MVINSVISLYYYILIAREMFFGELAEVRPFRAPALVTGVVVLAGIAVLAVGVFPDLLAKLPPAVTLP